MGSRSSSASATSTHTTNNDITRTVSSVDNRVAQDEAVIGGNLDIQSEGDIAGLSITQTDFGSVQASIDAITDIATGSGNLIDNTTGQIIATSNALNERALSFAETALQSGENLLTLALSSTETANEAALGGALTFARDSQQEQGGAINRTLMIAIIAAAAVGGAAILRR